MFTFVILHYKNIKDTLECVESIKKLPEENKKIVIVDNHTLNLEEKESLEKVCDKLICLEENLGFAKANNQGCNYAKNTFSPQFIIVINNDTIINQETFLKRIEKIYQETNFDILGPKIICKEGSGSVNPYIPLKTIEEVDNEIKYQRKLLKIYKHKLSFFLLKLGIRIKKIFKKTKIFRNGKLRQLNVALHGCALIFSEKYLKQFKNVFYNDTFLYHEESFLYKRIKENQLISVYDPELEIIHKEGASLDTKFSNKEQKKLIFRTTEILKSLELLKKEMEGK